MLRSYQYKSAGGNSTFTQNPAFREKEIKIARDYVSSHMIKRDLSNICPVCQKKTGEYFYTKWNVDYLCCSDCKTVFAVYDETVAAEYQKNPELVDMRCSQEYQEQATAGRLEMWQELLEWISVRTFRFLHRNKGLKIIDIGNRFEGYCNVIKESELCSDYNLRDSILKADDFTIENGQADMVFCFDQFQKEINPKEKLLAFKDYLKEDGLLVLNTRAGSGFDIITLRENNEKIYPYEHIFLPSVKGLVSLLEDCGYKILEITTPGVMDVNYVLSSLDKINGGDYFVKYLLTESDESTIQDFQRFLQKGCLSSYVSIIAQKGEK